MSRISARVQAQPDSSTVRLADIAAAMRRTGVDVVDFSAGRAAEHTPAPVVEAAVEAMRKGLTHQTPARGLPAYLAACAGKLERENGLLVDPEHELIATLGCKQGLTLALLATLDPGDEILVEDPAFVSYAPTIRLMGAVPVPVPLRAANRFRWDMAELEAAVTPRTRALLICSPHNPLGVVHTADDLAPIAALAERHDLTVIADEIYERVTWGGRRHVGIATLPGMRERTITLMGMTKTFSMGGWRIGFAFSSADIIDAMVRIQQHLLTCAGTFTQLGAAHALHAGRTNEVGALWSDWEARCNFMADALDAIPGVQCARPEGGFYAWTDISATGIDSVTLTERLLRDHAVVTVPGASFGPQGEGYLRITCVRSWEELHKGIERLRTAFATMAG